MGMDEATAAEDYVRAHRRGDDPASQKDAGVSELEGAMAFLHTVIVEQGDVVRALQQRLSPVLSADKVSPMVGETVAAVDERSDHVKLLNEQAERIRQNSEILQRTLARLDV